ncbi:P-loop containing nucleoside triphosphate hydrolase protein, partial [Amylostereum chailletii]
KPFQIEGMTAQVMGQDVLLHAATGSGKTGIAAGPHLLPSNKGCVTLVVSPLIALHTEQDTTFQEEFGLKAIAINSAYEGCTRSVMKRITEGEWQIVILSPEMLQSRCFVQHVLQRKEFGSRILSVFIDEAHCVSHWGDSFRKKYGTLGNVRAHLLHNIPFIAVSATLTPRVRRDILDKLQYSSNYLFINIGNDRPAVSQVVRAIEHPMNTYLDLDFVVPPTQMAIADIPKMFLYMDDIKAGSSIVDHLNQQVDMRLRDLGLVRPYTAAMSQKYRTAVMKLFKEGIIRVLVCTDAAGMGCNISDVDIVIQWKMPPTLSAWVQRAGRAARSPLCQGLAIMLVEKNVFTVDPSAPDPTAVSSLNCSHGKATQGTRIVGRKPTPTRSTGAARAKMPKGYAIQHGQHRRSSDGKHDEVEFTHEPEVPPDAAKEGLYAYIQTTVCRRQLLSKIYGNERSTPQEHCYDICNPTLFDHVRAPPPTRAPRQQAAKKHAPLSKVREALYAWRKTIKQENYPRSLVSPLGILSDDACELIASTTPFPTKDKLYKVFGSGWARWERHSNALYSILQEFSPPISSP